MYKEESEWEVLYMDPEDIKGISKYNARKVFPEKGLESLVTSMIETGINTEAIILDQHNEVIEGSRRYRAALIAKKRGLLDKVFCLKKNMSPTEAKIRSFLENEVRHTMSEKDKYLFIKDLHENEGIPLQKISDIIGVVESTARGWYSYEKVQDALRNRAEDLEESVSTRKKKIILRTLDHISDPDAAVTLKEEAPSIKTRVIEDLSKEAKDIGYMTPEKIKRMKRIGKEGEVLIRLYLPKSYIDRANRINKMVLPDLVRHDVFVTGIDIGFDVLERKHGLLR